MFMVRICSIKKAMTNPRMYGSKEWISRKAIIAKVQGLWGLVRIVVMKNPISLQAISSRQAYRGNLKTYVQIELSERGKSVTQRA